MKTLREIIGKNIFVYGDRKSYLDLKEVFFELSFSGYSVRQEDVVNKLNQKNTFVVICYKQELENIWKYKEKVIYETDFIELLNYPLIDACKNKELYVWGTGCWCKQLEEYLTSHKNMPNIKRYIDTDEKKQGTLRNGILIQNPENVDFTNAFVILAMKETAVFELTQYWDNPAEFVSVQTVIYNIAEDFRKIYEEDTFINTSCKNLDDNIRIWRDGEVATCCMSNGSFGNIFLDRFQDIWNSRRALINRLALKNQSYVFCNAEKCGFLSGLKREKVNRNKYELIEIPERQFPESIAPAVDITCNLSCTSCRKQVLSDISSDRELYVEIILNDIVKLPTRFLINTIGEPFSSKYCKKILNDKRTLNRKQMGIYSNGTLLSKKKLDDLIDHFSELDIAISIDAATKKTYEKIRRGGKWENLIENLRYICSCRKMGRVSYFQINFVVQKDNVFEMQKFVDWAKQLQCDRVVMNAIENWGVYTEEEFKSVSVLNKDGIKPEYRRYFTEKLIHDPLVNYVNIANYLNLDVPKILMM